LRRSWRILLILGMDYIAARTFRSSLMSNNKFEGDEALSI
jgi:hypothetical protein